MQEQDALDPMGQAISDEPITQRPDMQPKFNIKLSEAAQTELINMLVQFKQSCIDHDTNKKEKMQRAYAYTKSEFVDGEDGPPRIVDQEGTEYDAATGRSALFYPLTRQIIKQLYAQIKLTMFPNDEDYMRVRAKNDKAAPYEDSLTEGLKWKFKQAKMSEKAGKGLYNLLWAGNAPAYPKITRNSSYEWQWVPSKTNPQDGKWEMKQIEGEALPDLECWNPLHFYIDPMCSNYEENTRWMYCCKKKVHEFTDQPQYYMNVDRLDDVGKTDWQKGQTPGQRLSLDAYNGLNHGFQDIIKHVDYDLFYIPYLVLDGQEYRNMVAGLAAETVLVRFHPNTMPYGINPVAFGTWFSDADSPWGTSPAEDLIPIQQIINHIINYVIESAARNSNRWAISNKMNISQFWGAAGGVITGPVDDIRKHVMQVGGTMQEAAGLLDFNGMLAATGQQLAGANNPFQGASDIDFKKTATEMTLIAENAMTVIREAVEHIGSMFMQDVYKRSAYLIGEEYRDAGPVKVRVDDAINGTQYIDVDFSLLLSGDFYIELTSVNMAQSKMAMVNTLMQLLEVMQSNPELWMMTRDNGYHIIKMLMDMQGIKHTDQLLMTPSENQRNQIVEGLMQALEQGGVEGLVMAFDQLLGGMNAQPAQGPDPGQPGLESIPAA